MIMLDILHPPLLDLDDRQFLIGEVAEPADPLEVGLISHWTFGDGAGDKLTDRVGGNHGTLTNGPAWVPGRAGSALSFDGSDDYVTATLSNGPTTNAWTTTAWIYAKSKGSYFNIVTARIVLQPDVWLGIILSGATNNPVVGLWDGGGGDSGNYNLNTGLTFNLNEWVFVAAVVTPNGITTYRNINSFTRSYSTTNRNTGSPNTWQIGTQIDNLSRTWNGLLDDVRIYNRALSASEVSELYQRTLPVRRDTWIGCGVFVSAGATFAQSLSLSLSSTLVLTRSVGKAVSLGVSTTLGAARETARGISNSVSATLSLLRNVGKTIILSASQTSTLTVATTFARTLSASVSAVILLANSVGKAVSLSVSSTSTFVKETIIMLSVAVAAVTTFAHDAGKVFAVGVASVASLVRSPAKSFAVAVGVVASVVRSASKVLNLAASSESSAVRSVARSLNLSVSEASTLDAIRTFLQTILASASSATTMVRSVAKSIALSVSAPGKLVKSIATGISISAGSQSVLAKSAVRLKSLAVTVASNLSLGRAVGKVMNLAASSQSSVVRSIGSLVKARWGRATAGASLTEGAQAGVVRKLSSETGETR